MNEPTKPSSPERRAAIGRARSYFLAWLLSAFAFVGAMFADFANKVAAKEIAAGTSGAYATIGLFVVIGAFVALLSLPILYLLRVVPEPSARSGVRLVRRLVVGLICGLLLGGLVGALIAAGGKSEPKDYQFYSVLGAIFGLIAGLIDSIALDDAGRAHDDGNAGADGPAS